VLILRNSSREGSRTVAPDVQHSGNAWCVTRTSLNRDCSTALTRIGIVKAQQDLAERMDEHTLAKNPVGETLVCFPIEDLQVVTDPTAERAG
jgi:hypothetical protein